MNRRDFLSKIPHAMAITGAGMFAAAKALDAQPEVLHVQPMPDLILWRRVINGKPSWYEIRETITNLDGTFSTRLFGAKDGFVPTVESKDFYRDGRLVIRSTKWDYQFWPKYDWA